MAKITLYGHEARCALQRGIDALADAVRVTLGPRGRNAVLDRHFGAPLVTNDGVTIANEMFLRDPFENMGAQLIKEVARRTNDVAGDGTTTATILAQAMIAEGMKNVAAGANPVWMKYGILAAADLAVAAMRDVSRGVEGTEDIARVGAVSSGDEAIGRMIADTMERLSLGAVITVEESRTTETCCEVVEGMEFDRGYLTAHMITDPKRMEAVIEHPFILLTDRKISAFSEILPVMEAVAKVGGKLFIVADSIENDALANIVVNKMRGKFTCVCAKAPSFGDRRRDLLGDMAALTGATVVTEELGMALREVRLDMLGRAALVKCGRERSVIIGGEGRQADIDARIAQVQNELALATFDYDVAKLRERLGKLSGGVAVIRVGAHTDVELQEKKLRIEDALHATHAAVQEGIVPGGGTAYIAAARAVEAELDTLEGDARVGAALVAKALRAPLRQIARNAGAESSVVLQRVEAGEGAFGYDAAAGRCCDLYAAGIIDPVMVCRCALENAASVAGVVLTTEVLIAEEPKPLGSPEQPR